MREVSKGKSGDQDEEERFAICSTTWCQWEPLAMIWYYLIADLILGLRKAWTRICWCFWSKFLSFKFLAFGIQSSPNHHRSSTQRGITSIHDSTCFEVAVIVHLVQEHHYESGSKDKAWTCEHLELHRGDVLYQRRCLCLRFFKLVLYLIFIRWNIWVRFNMSVGWTIDFWLSLINLKRWFRLINLPINWYKL